MYSTNYTEMLLNQATIAKVSPKECDHKNVDVLLCGNG